MPYIDRRALPAYLQRQSMQQQAFMQQQAQQQAFAQRIAMMDYANSQALRMQYQRQLNARTVLENMVQTGQIDRDQYREMNAMNDGNMTGTQLVMMHGHIAAQQMALDKAKQDHKVQTQLQATADAVLNHNPNYDPTTGLEYHAGYIAQVRREMGFAPGQQLSPENQMLVRDQVASRGGIRQWSAPQRRGDQEPPIWDFIHAAEHNLPLVQMPGTPPGSPITPLTMYGAQTLPMRGRLSQDNPNTQGAQGGTGGQGTGQGRGAIPQNLWQEATTVLGVPPVRPANATPQQLQTWNTAIAAYNRDRLNHINQALGHQQPSQQASQQPNNVSFDTIQQRIDALPQEQRSIYQNSLDDARALAAPDRRRTTGDSATLNWHLNFLNRLAPQQVPPSQPQPQQGAPTILGAEARAIGNNAVAGVQNIPGNVAANLSNLGNGNFGNTYLGQGLQGVADIWTGRRPGLFALEPQGQPDQGQPDQGQ